MSQTYPPPPIFLTGFGKIRKLTLKRTGGDVSSPVLPVAPPLLASDICTHETPGVLHNIKLI